ncbi:MAG TPA: F0F1 ATP synthase subunit A [Candidatus Dormibacteraeota bacterium]|nr:F0F1 ATP synthase subunit A [Candidatus Dormibacteraeota bacterium]
MARFAWVALITLAAIGALALFITTPPAEGASLIHVAIGGEKLLTVGSFEVTNSMVGAVLASLLLLAAAWYISRRSALIPHRLQSLLELPVEWVAGIVEGSTSRWRGYVALVIGLFLMILVANWIGLLPGVGTIGLKETVDGHEVVVPIVRPAAADLNFTLGLAIITFVVFVWWGVRINGPVGYLKELVGEPRYMAPLMLPIHLISELSRLVSLSMRLFGNVFAGEVLIATMLALTTATFFVLPFALFVPAIFLGLELLFGAVQAIVFALLTMTYITMAIAEHDGGHEPEQERREDHPESDTHSAASPA